MNPPDGMKVVSKAEFYELLKADLRNIMPSVQNETFTFWKDKSDNVFGWSAPGWKNVGEFPMIYAIK